jgi:hypothetical protein
MKRSRSRPRRPSRKKGTPEERCFSSPSEDDDSNDDDSDFEEVQIAKPKKPRQNNSNSSSTSESTSSSTSSSTTGAPPAPLPVVTSTDAARRGKYGQWGDKRYFVTEEDLSKEMERMATNEFGWHPDIGKNARADVWWGKNNTNMVDNITYTTYMCPFGSGAKKNSKGNNCVGICSRQFQVLEHDDSFSNGSKYAVRDRMRLGDYVKHNRHDVHVGSQVPKYFKIMFTQTFLEQYSTPTAMIQFFRNEFKIDPTKAEKGIAVNATLKKQLKAYRKNVKKKFIHLSTGVTPRQGVTYGGIFSVLSKYKIVGNDIHASYVLKKWMDSATGYIVAVMSTQNLLLNGVRMFQVPGVTACLEIDCTYRLMTEGFSLAVIGTVSVDQKFHVIAYAICNHENTATFQFIMGTVRGEIDRLMSEKV